MRDQVAPAFDMNDTLIADGGSGSGYVSEGYLGQCDSNCYYEMDEGCCVLPESLDLPAVPIRRVKSASNLLQLPRRSSRSRKSSDDSAVGSADDSDVSDKSDNNLSASSSTETQDMLCATARTTMSRQPGSGSHSGVLTTTTPVNPSDPQPSSSRSSVPVFSSSVLLPAQLSASSRSSSSNSVKSVGHQRQMSAPAPPVTPPQCHFAVVRSSSDDHEMKMSEACAEGLPSSKLFDLLRPPSVVVSDHDLSPSVDRYLTLDDLDAEFQNNLSRRRLSDCSTCSTLSLNEPEVFIGTLSGDEPEAEETALTKKDLEFKREAS